MAAWLLLVVVILLTAAGVLVPWKSILRILIDAYWRLPDIHIWGVIIKVGVILTKIVVPLRGRILESISILISIHITNDVYFI